jgi:two-component system response regulator GlrR
LFEAPMSWRIAVVDGVGAPFDAAGLAGTCEGDRLEFFPVAPTDIRTFKADLLLVVAHGQESTDAWLRSLRDTPVAMPVFAVLPEQPAEPLLRLTAELAADFVIAPAGRDEIRQRVSRILGEPPSEVAALQNRLIDEIGLKHLVGRDPAFLRVIAQIPLVARSNRPVLVTGETGTGKELCARAIHHLGKRRDFPFIPIDCGAFPDQLFENEMFGHERGAYTGAHRDQRGLIATAEGGTLFLDEIDSLSASAQAKLLRFLQDRTYRPLGGDRMLHANVNVVAATNRDLETLVAEQKFRADLFFRLSVLRLHMIPLRERRDDIPLLAQHFLDSMCIEDGVPRKALAPIAVVELRRQDWPGNVRELHNVVQRAFVSAPGAYVLPLGLAAAQRTPDRDSAGGAPEGGSTFRAARARAIEAFERQYVLEMLKAHDGNITQAARCAGQDRRAFGRLVKRHGIDRTRIA